MSNSRTGTGSAAVDLSARRGMKKFSAKQVPQRDSKDLSQVDWLKPTAPPSVAEPVHVDPGVIYRQPDFHAALVWTMISSGAQESQLADFLDVDNGTLTRIKQAKAHVPTKRIPDIMKEGDYAPLYWLLKHLGFDPASLRRIESEETARLRAELEAERTARHEAERKTELMMELWKETRA